VKIGDYIMRLTGLDQFSPPFMRRGQGALFSVDVLAVPSNGAGLLIDVEHKNEGDTVWSSLGSFTTITSTGVKTLDLTGAKEMLRFNFSISGGSGASPADTFYIDVLAPVWRQ
jgi:hypothetical protein